MGRMTDDEATPPDGNPESGLKRLWHLLQIGLAIVAVIGAAWLLYHQFKQVQPQEILEGLVKIGPWKTLLAIGLTFLNYLILVGYDWSGTRYVQHPLKLWRIALASFICYALSHNLGWFLGGPPSRYRMYTAAGLSTMEIVKLVAILWVAYWTGFFALAGVVFVIWPLALPPHLNIQDELVKLPELNARPLGVVFIVGVCLYLLATAVWKVPLKVRGQTLGLPPFRLSLFMVTTAMLDIAVGSTVLYVLLPPEMHVSLPTAMSVYLLAMVVVITVHMPGGTGVFEAVVTAILAPRQDQLGDLAAALLVYRAVYYWMPLLIAVVGLAVHEVWVRKGRPGPLVAPKIPAKAGTMNEEDSG